MRLYFDSNIFIYAFECETDLGSAARRAFGLVDRAEAVGVTSELTLAEVLPYPLKASDVRLQYAYESVFEGRRLHFETYPVALRVLRLSARLVADSAMQAADAIHVATAIDAACDAFVTEDKRVKVPPSIRSLTLSDAVFV